ncbi:MAG: recombinase family protein [Deltaproteobacteria bacterium]|nr:recombinase family protein [Deltaproteobacteria bacterium]
MKAIEFLRVSTQEQSNDDRAGLARQKEANARTIAKYKLEVVEVIKLIDVSGTSVMHTPEMGKLLSLIERDDIKGVVVADHDRLFRPDNFNDFALLQNFITTNTLIYTSDQIIDLTTQGGFLLAGIQAIISGNELTQIKKRMLEAKEIKRKAGEHPNSAITLPRGVGYDRDSKKFSYNDKIDEVKNLFELFLVGGIQNYRELERLTGIQHRTIANLLKNEIYMGFRTYTEKRSSVKGIKNDGRQGDRKKVKRKLDEIIRVKVIENPIIDEASFNKIQTIINKKNVEYHKKKSKKGQRFLYSGFLRCGECGAILYSTSGGSNHNKDYYYCRSKSYLFKNRIHESACSSSYYPKNSIETSITSLLSEKLTEVDYIKKMLEMALNKTHAKDNEREAVRTKEKIKSKEKEKSKYLELFVKDLFPREELEQKVNKLNDELNNLKQSLVEIEDSYLLQDKINIEKDIKSVVETLVEFPFWTPTQKREFLRSQIPELSITKDGVSSITLSFCKLRNHMGRDSSPPPA